MPLKLFVWFSFKLDLWVDFVYYLHIKSLLQSSANILLKGTKQRCEVAMTWKKTTLLQVPLKYKIYLKKNIYLFVFLCFYIIYEYVQSI